MNKYFLLLLLLSPSLFSLGLEEVITRALEKSPSLEAITYRMTASHSTVDSSNQFSNPVISLADNTLPSNQAMSRSTLSLAQKLPYFGKRDSLEKIALAQEGVIGINLEQAKVALVNEIKNQAYGIWELEELYKIIEEYEHVTRQNIGLFESYTATYDNQHMGIMSAELTLSDLKIQGATLEAQIEVAYAKLSYLAAFEINDIELSLVVWDLPLMSTYEEGLLNNKDLSLRNKEISKNQAMTETADLNNYPDVNVLASYAYREKFDNFFTFGIGMSLPIYGTEDYKEEEAKALTLSAISLKEDTKIAIHSDFRTAYAQMKSAFKIYHIVQDDALPQVEHMFELTSSSISTGGDLFKYIDILVQKLKLEQKSIAAVAIYNRSMAKIEALSGETE
ncbi:TolC family protein [Sulfurimonas sp. MAG313]|nr:TolC family protein [Sulfurimonas sp. MAG313]MDF1880191.1 TolC family protein [Sulfurimonas sp. MAG313]